MLIKKKTLGHNLDGDMLLIFGIPRLPDDSHSSLAENMLKLISSALLAFLKAPSRTSCHPLIHPILFFNEFHEGFEGQIKSIC
jgi:hypothetical protein